MIWNHPNPNFVQTLAHFCGDRSTGRSMMRWEVLEMQQGGPGKRWGHTCNAVRGGQLLYFFGGFCEDKNSTNRVHVFDTSTRSWSEPEMQGELPVPRHSHSCTAVGDKLFVFGGEGETVPLNDLHVLDTSTNTWMTPDVRGEGPDARESHSAAAIGKLLFIFGGYVDSSDTRVVKSFDDLYILNTETMVWKRVVTKGIRPCKRIGQSCVSWKNKVIVIGGEDTKQYYMSGVWMLDTDTLTWTKLVTNGKPLPRRAWHTTVALGKNLFVLGGYIDDRTSYDDLYMFDLETFKWTEVKPKGARPLGRFLMTGSTTHPQHGGVLAFMGGCNKKLKPADDMFYLHTGIVIENEGDHASSYDIQVSDGLNVYHNANGKRPFQAEVTESITNCKTIETVIDGKPLREVLSLNKAADDLRKRVAVDSGKKGFELAMTDATKSPEHQTPGAISVASDMKTPTVSNASPSLEVSEYNKMNASTAAEDTANSFHNHDGQSQLLATEEHGLPSSPIQQV